MTMPTFPSSNMEKPVYPASMTMPWTTRFVLVPMSVHTPPRMVAYDKGMRNFVGESRWRSAQRLIIGAKITTTGVLLRKAEMKATAGSMRACTPRMVARRLGNRCSRSVLSSPERRTPSLTRKSIATVIMPLLEKPSRSSFGLKMPAHMKATAPESRMRPGRMRSLMSAMMSTDNMMMTNMAWNPTVVV